MTAAVGVAGAWVEVCALERIPVGGGVAALLPGDGQAAVFRTARDTLHAVSNIDPIAGVAVLSRGIVGDASGEPVVASPLHKHRFSLRTGECLDDPSASVPVLPTRLRGGMVHVCAPR